jgi:adenylate cyclase
MSGKKLKTQLDDKRYSHLPARVVRVIHGQQDVSERLIGWFQLSVVVLWGIIYTVSPKTFSTETTFALVPWVLSVYLLLTFIRLYIAHRSRISASIFL